MSERVRYCCPACGSELETPEGTVSNLCTYCGQVSLLGRPGRVLKSTYPPACDAQEARVIAERQVRKEGLPLLASVEVQLHYVPFYRFRGLALDCLSKRRAASFGAAYEGEVKQYELRARHVDVTSPACSLNPFELSSLGIRPQAVTAWAFRDDEFAKAAQVWPVDRTPPDAEAAALRMNAASLVLAHGDKEREFTEMVGERQVLVYFPVFLITGRTGSPAVDVTMVIDGMSKRVLSTQREPWQAPRAPLAIENHPAWKPEAHACPNCGDTLPPSERSLYYPCGNCSRHWLLTAEGYQPVVASLVGEGPGELYPFWRFPLAFHRRPEVATVGAFSRLLTADIPLLDKRKRDRLFHVYVPAFSGADADWQVQIAVRMTRTQPLVEPCGPNRKEVAAVSLPASEGQQFARFAWDWLRVSYMNLRSPEFAWRAGAAGSPELVWLPVASERLERSTARAVSERSRAY